MNHTASTETGNIVQLQRSRQQLEQEVDLLIAIIDNMEEERVTLTKRVDRLECAVRNLATRLNM